MFHLLKLLILFCLIKIIYDIFSVIAVSFIQKVYKNVLLNNIVESNKEFIELPTLLTKELYHTSLKNSSDYQN